MVLSLPETIKKILTFRLKALANTHVFIRVNTKNHVTKKVNQIDLNKTKCKQRNAIALHAHNIIVQKSMNV